MAQSSKRKKVMGSEREEECQVDGRRESEEERENERGQSTFVFEHK